MEYDGRLFDPAVDQAVVQGRCSMGTFNRGLKRVNLLEARRPLGFPVPGFIKNRRLKEWEAFQIANEEWFICLAVYDTKIAGVGFVFLYNKKRERLYSYQGQAFRRRIQVPAGLRGTVCRFSTPKLQIEIENRLEENRFSITFSAAADEGLPACRGHFTAEHVTEPLVILQPFAENRPLYSHKALMPGEGTLVMGDTEFPFRRGATGLILDDHKGYYPRRLRYDWVTAIGFRNGSPLGFNLTENQIRDPEENNENCLWWEGRTYLLPPVHFSRPEGRRGPWLINDDYGLVNLTFHPVTAAVIRNNFGLIATDYYGPNGGFQGHIRGASGEPVTFDGFIGMGERREDRM